MKKLFAFLDDRTGLPSAWRRMLDQQIEGGARWAYVFGSGLAVVFVCQLVTGLLLATTYSPSTHDAWSSVFYIQHRMPGGAFLRGLHHYGAYAMMIVMGLHLIQVVVYGAYKKPREVNWWLGLALMGCVVVLGLSGYLLPWDQKGYWATTVATNITGSMPIVGPTMRDLVVGGPSYGQATLTHAFAAHVALLPGLIGLILVGHVVLSRRHGPTPPAGADLGKKEAYFPGQIAMDMGFAVAVVLGMGWAAAKIGAPLDAPADPSIVYPPRPEMYFLWLYQLLNLVPGKVEFLVTLGLPTVGGLVLFALPFLDRRPSTRVRERLAIVIPVLLAAAAILGLTWQALATDAHDHAYQAQRHDADRRAARAVELAENGIPPGGPLVMLDDDPMTRGRDVFAKKCGTCHVMDGVGEHWAPEHTGYASRAWIRMLLHDPDDARAFGATEIDGMPSQDRLDHPTPGALAAVTEFLYAEGREPQDPPVDAALVHEGQRVFESKCMNCHMYGDDGDYLGESGPNLLGWASRTWITRQIATPARDTNYGETNKMPAFAEELSEHDIAMVAAYLRQQRFAEPDTGRLRGKVPRRAQERITHRAIHDADDDE